MAPNLNATFPRFLFILRKKTPPTHTHTDHGSRGASLFTHPRSPRPPQDGSRSRRGATPHPTLGGKGLLQSGKARRTGFVVILLEPNSMSKRPKSGILGSGANKKTAGMFRVDAGLEGGSTSEGWKWLLAGSQRPNQTPVCGGGGGEVVLCLNKRASPSPGPQASALSTLLFPSV